MKMMPRLPDLVRRNWMRFENSPYQRSFVKIVTLLETFKNLYLINRMNFCKLIIFQWHQFFLIYDHILSMHWVSDVFHYKCFILKEPTCAMSIVTRYWCKPLERRSNSMSGQWIRHIFRIIQKNFTVYKLYLHKRRSKWAIIHSCIYYFNQRFCASFYHRKWILFIYFLISGSMSISQNQQLSSINWRIWRWSSTKGQYL